MDELLALIKFTKIKKRLLSQMMELDFKNQTDTDDYIKLINNYKLVCDVYDKKLSKLTEVQKTELIFNINSLNSKLLTIHPLEELLHKNNHYNVLTRVILDLSNSSLINFYGRAVGQKDCIFVLFSHLGFDCKNNSSINIDMVNECMNQDFINSLFVNIKNKIQTESDIELKKELFEWKYQLILLSSSLESRALLTNFSIPETAKLTGQITIETSGMIFEEYLQEFDSIIVNNMFGILKHNLMSDQNNTFYLDSIFFETLLKLLNNCEYVDIIEMEVENYIQTDLSKQKIERFCALLEMLKENQNNGFDYQIKRKYFRI